MSYCKVPTFRRDFENREKKVRRRTTSDIRSRRITNKLRERTLHFPSIELDHAGTAVPLLAVDGNLDSVFCSDDG